MRLVEGLVLNIIFLLFPFFVYLLFVAHSVNNDKKGKNIPILLDAALITSVYLIIVYSKYVYTTTFMLLINIPLVIAIYKQRKFATILISISISLFYYYFYKIPLFASIIEYQLYILVFFILLRIKIKKSYEFILNLFTFVKGVVLSIEIMYILPSEESFIVLILELFIMLTFFYLTTIIITNIIDKGNDIVSFNSILKELEKEKKLKNSLFKITHEVKNPIAVVKGYLSMIDYNNLEKAKKYNNIIKNEVDRTLDILEDFSDYTKINVKLDIMDFNMLLEEVLDVMMSIFKNNNIKVEYPSLDDELLILGDYNRLKQVFVNVLKNSVEAINNINGLIKIDVNLSKKDIEISITDNGCGMDDDELKKTGELFYTTKSKGTGLGVSLSKEIIKAHNGTMKYQSSKNKGTTVIINIPIKD